MCIIVGGSELEASAVPYLGRFGGNKKTEGTLLLCPCSSPKDSKQFIFCFLPFTFSFAFLLCYSHVVVIMFSSLAGTGSFKEIDFNQYFFYVNHF